MSDNDNPQAKTGPNSDEAPDLSRSPWLEKLDAAAVRVGRPKSESPKVSTTIRLDPDVLERFRQTGPGWQSRINAALRDWLAEKG
ncbi:BrnA antitoxin family protein [Ciceribacter sp. T2.26MG-112.2]|uniref:BrnA antitoxin family protein n=1 Tax=Ciceribacter sp. T2.26MG-112.2 TaxID=3137154 RepID=UPI0012B6A73B|nr:BrnA antitoxin family protein [Ciceribacter naphthalenivorans]